MRAVLQLRMVRSILRQCLKRFPRLRRRLLPGYMVIKQCSWWVRSNFGRKAPITVQTKAGPIRIIPQGHIARLLWDSDFETEERRAIESLLRPGMRVVNVGANVGLYTVLCGKAVGIRGEVYAFEPASLNFERLGKNIALNGLTNIHATRCAISDGPREMHLQRDPEHPELDSHYSAGAINPCGADYIETVPATSLDEYWRQANRSGAVVDLMIIDVEGGELGVLAGAVGLLRASLAITIMVECTKNLGGIEKLAAVEGFRFHGWDSKKQEFVGTDLGRGNVFMFRPR